MLALLNNPYGKDHGQAEKEYRGSCDLIQPPDTPEADLLSEPVRDGCQDEPPENGTPPHTRNQGYKFKAGQEVVCHFQCGHDGNEQQDRHGTGKGKKENGNKILGEPGLIQSLQPQLFHGVGIEYPETDVQYEDPAQDLEIQVLFFDEIYNYGKPETGNDRKYNIRRRRAEARDEPGHIPLVQGPLNAHYADRTQGCRDQEAHNNSLYKSGRDHGQIQTKTLMLQIKE